MSMRHSSHPHAPTRPYRVLLVEDNPGDVRLTHLAFAQCDILLDLDVARSGEDAVDYLQRAGTAGQPARPDLVLLDLNLSGMDGHTVLKIVKGDERLRAIPIVVLSSSSAESDVALAYQSGSNGYVSKGLDFTTFKAVIQSIAAFWLQSVLRPSEDFS